MKSIFLDGAMGSSCGACFLDSTDDQFLLTSHRRTKGQTHLFGRVPTSRPWLTMYSPPHPRLTRGWPSLTSHYWDYERVDLDGSIL